MSFVSVLTPSTEGTAGDGAVRIAAGSALMATDRPSSNGGRHTAADRPADLAGPEPFVVGVERRADDVVIVRPRGELDLASEQTLRTTLDAIERARRLVLDLRGLSFIDCAGLHLLVALHERAQRDGSELAIIAPAAPTDRPIRLLGLDATLPFVTPADAADGGPCSSS